MDFTIGVEPYTHYPTHTSPDSIIIMNKVFGILLGWKNVF
jgi:hypothetical protein